MKINFITNLHEYFKKIKKENTKIISIYTGNKKIVNQTYLKYYNTGKIIIGGLDLCIYLSSEKSKYTFNWELKNQDIVKIKNTIDFINCINNNKNTKLYTLASHKFICNLIFNSYNSIKINKNFETYINNLYTLSYELNLPFYFNETFNERDINNAYKLTSIINHNEINNPIIKFSTDDNILLKDFYNKILNYDNLIIDYNNEEIKILNQTLNLADFFQYNIIGINNIEIIDNSIIISASKIQTIIKDDESIFESKKN